MGKSIIRNPFLRRIEGEDAEGGGTDDASTDTDAGQRSADDDAGSDTGATDGDGGGEDLASQIEAQKKVNRDLEKKLKAARIKGDRVTELESELAKAQGKEAEFEEMRKARETEAAALEKANGRIVRSEIKAAAKGVLEDPTDAFTFLDPSDFEVDDDGNVDESAIASALKDLVARKPYLAAQGGRRFQGGADGGARKDARPSQLTQSDVDRMSPDQIVTAKEAGRLNDLLGIK